MQVLAYWITNFTFDLIKMYLIVCMNLMIFAYFNINLGDAIYTLLVFPLGMIPFSYVSSFVFRSVSVAQSLTLFFNFVLMLLIPFVIEFMQRVDQLEGLGDILAQIFKLHPAFCLTKSIIFVTTDINEIYELRVNEDGTFRDTSLISSETWHLLNLKGDCLALICHMIISFLLILLIENR